MFANLLKLTNKFYKLAINSKITDFSNTLFNFIQFLKNFEDGVLYTTNPDELYLLINLIDLNPSNKKRWPPHIAHYLGKIFQIFPKPHKIKLLKDLEINLEIINADFPVITKEDIEVSLDELKDKGLIPNEQITSQLFKDSLNIINSSYNNLKKVLTYSG